MILGAVFSPGPPTTVFTVDWDRDMDAGVTPAVGSFIAVVDSIPVSLTIIGWAGARTLVFSYPAGPPLIFGMLHLVVEDPNLRSLLGETAKPPMQQAFFP